MSLKTVFVVSLVFFLAGCGSSKGRLCDQLIDKQKVLVKASVEMLRKKYGDKKAAEYEERIRQKQGKAKEVCMQQSEEKIKRALKLMDMLKKSMEKR